MKNKSSSIPVAMLTRKFYCHECGEQLTKNKKTRIVKQKDPDHKEHSRIGGTQMVGDVELTEYDFKCPSCGKLITYDKQCVIEQIQKIAGRHTLSETEITENRERAENELDRNNRIISKIFTAVFVAIIILVLYLRFR